MNFTEFRKFRPNFISKFITLILTEKLQSHSLIVTETLNGVKYMTSLPLWVKRRIDTESAVQLCKI